MNTLTLPVSASHPPDTEDREVLQIPVPIDRRKLALADRISLRVGIWLLSRAQRPRRLPIPRDSRSSASLFLPGSALSERESLALLTYDLHRQMR